MQQGIATGRGTVGRRRPHLSGTSPSALPAADRIENRSSCPAPVIGRGIRLRLPEDRSERGADPRANASSRLGQPDPWTSARWAAAATAGIPQLWLSWSRHAGVGGWFLSGMRTKLFHLPVWRRHAANHVRRGRFRREPAFLGSRSNTSLPTQVDLWWRTG